jgi:hypothetical protein
MGAFVKRMATFDAVFGLRRSALQCFGSQCIEVQFIYVTCTEVTCSDLKGGMGAKACPRRWID